mmetsp:Transcript_87914/g.284603  ORF Transcript_87914/g.284603 Transcript_87914/m.284603 type:complete len:366 (+) Transcript_87914:1311-2408(+)
MRLRVGLPSLRRARGGRLAGRAVQREPGAAVPAARAAGLPAGLQAAALRLPAAAARGRARGLEAGGPLRPHGGPAARRPGRAQRGLRRPAGEGRHLLRDARGPGGGPGGQGARRGPHGGPRHRLLLPAAVRPARREVPPATLQHGGGGALQGAEPGAELVPGEAQRRRPRRADAQPAAAAALRVPHRLGAAPHADGLHPQPALEALPRAVREHRPAGGAGERPRPEWLGAAGDPEDPLRGRGPPRRHLGLLVHLRGLRRGPHDLHAGLLQHRAAPPELLHPHAALGLVPGQAQGHAGDHRCHLRAAGLEHRPPHGADAERLFLHHDVLRRHARALRPGRRLLLRRVLAGQVVPPARLVQARRLQA